MPKYYITKSRFVHQVGHARPALVKATPDEPAIIEVPEHHHKKPAVLDKDGKVLRPASVDRDLRPVEEGAPGKLQPHFAVMEPAVSQALTAPDVQSTPLVEAPKPAGKKA